MLRRIQVLFSLILLAGLIALLSFYWSSQVVGLFSILVFLTTFSILLVILLENRNPQRTLIWAIVMLGFPVVGLFAYFVFGQNYRRKRMFKEKAMLDEETYLAYRQKAMTLSPSLMFAHDDYEKLMHLTSSLNQLPVSSNTYTQVLTNGREKFPKLLAALRGATRHIHLEYYIFRDDRISREIQQLLIEKAKSGVEVRFLYDAVGSIHTGKAFFDEMKQAGVQVRAFFPVVLPLVSSKTNYRNHRKIVVIDGTEAFTGGLNIGDEYLGKDAKFGFWRDTHLYVRGEGVSELQLVFLQDWYYMTGERLFTPFFLEPLETVRSASGGVQIVASGPDEPYETMKSIYFALINSAKRSVYISSPYLIPDEDLMSALKTAALSGIDVRIVLPSYPDHKIVFYASRSYFEELLHAGVKIYLYEEGFMHSKVIVVDDGLATIGTANMDFRSFHLNFEVNALLYNTNSVHQLKQDFYQDFEGSTELDVMRFAERSFFIKLVESLARMFSPLL